jgi:hypothetical protein
MTRNPIAMKLFYHASRLRLTIEGEKSYPTVKPAWAAPLSRPGKYLALLDGKDKEIALLADPGEKLDEASWRAVQDELRVRYLTSRVQSVRSAKQEFGATYWSVESDRGARDFVTQNLQENAQWLGDDHLLLIDVDGNRFEIASVRALDDRSRALLEEIL